MKSNALLFPCDVELLSMIEYIDFGDYNFIFCWMPYVSLSAKEEGV